MHRRDLLKLSPLALASSAGHLSFAAAPHTTADGRPAPIYDVRAFGATGDGKTVDTPAINAAIEAASAAGGGTVVFPAGTYVCFTIRLKSNIELHLSRGCTVLAADSPLPTETTGYRGGTYDPAGPPNPWEQYEDFGHNHWANSLFYAENAHDFSITGAGLIFGKGLSHGSPHPEQRGPYPYYKAEQAGVGNKALAFKNCPNVLLRDFSVLKGGHFCLLATGVDNLVLDNITVDTDRDGFDIDCCRNVRVTQCTVNSPWDDGICPKSSFALGYQRPTDNVTIDSCYVTGVYEIGSVIDGTWKRYPESLGMQQLGRIKCGTESNGGFRNIAISNCVFEACRGLCLESVDGAFLEDIAVTNITMRDIVDAPLFVRLGRRNRGPGETMRPGTLRRVLISNIVSHNANSSTCSLLVGLQENPIEDVKIADCFFGHKGFPTQVLKATNNMNTGKPFPDWKTLQVPELEDSYPELMRWGPTPSNAFFIRHLKHLEMSHVEVAPQVADPRPAWWLEDVTRADFFAVTAPTTTPNFSLKNVNDLRIGWSRAAKDTVLAHADSQQI
jgi:polygalacturonase